MSNNRGFSDLIQIVCLLTVVCVEVPFAIPQLSVVFVSHRLPREAKMHILSPLKCFRPKILTQLPKDLTADHFGKVVSPTHEDWIKDLNQVKSTKVFVLCDFLDLIFQFLDVLFGRFHNENILLLGRV